MQVKSYSYYIIVVLTFLIIFFVALNSTAYKNALRVSDGEVIPFGTMIDEIKTARIIFVGENHEDKRHHQAQFDIIKGIQKSGSPISIGLEMFRAQDQDKLDLWIEGRLQKETFIEIYYDYWNLPWPLYRDIFLFSRNHGIPLIGLNVPKNISRKISRSGFSSLTSEELRQLPPGITCDDIDEDYRNFIRKAYEVHHRHGSEFDYFCEAQMVWDKSMAWYLMTYMRDVPGRKVIVLAGIGHSWRRAIPEQVRKQSDHLIMVVLPEVPGKVTDNTISPDDADYILLK